MKKTIYLLILAFLILISIASANITLGEGVIFNITDNNVEYYVTTDAVVVGANITVNTDSLIIGNQTFNEYSESIVTRNLVFFNVTVYNGSDDVIINIWDLYITYGDDNAFYAITSGKGFGVAINNSALTVSVRKTGHASETYSWTPVLPFYNLIFYLFEKDSLAFTFLDGRDYSLLNTTTVNMDLWSSSYSNNFTTSNGTIDLKNMDSGDYTLRYWATNFAKRYHYFTLVSEEYYNTSLVLLPSNLTTNVTVTIIDQDARKLEGAYVKALRYDLASNNYILQEIGRTNWEGETVMALTLYDEYYKFMIQYDERTLLTTNPYVLTSDTLLIQVNTEEAAFQDFWEWGSIETDLYFNTATDNFVLSYNDVNGILNGQVCLYTYQNKPTGDVLVASTCTSAASGTIIQGVTSGSELTYTAKAYYDGLFLDSETYNYPITPITGNLGLLLQLLITLAFASIALWDVSVLPISIGFSLIMGRLLQFNGFGWGAIAAFFVVMLIIAWTINRYKN